MLHTKIEIGTHVQSIDSKDPYFGFVGRIIDYNASIPERLPFTVGYFTKEDTVEYDKFSSHRVFYMPGELQYIDFPIGHVFSAAKMIIDQCPAFTLFNDIRLESCFKEDNPNHIVQMYFALRDKGNYYSLSGASKPGAGPISKTVPEKACPTCSKMNDVGINKCWNCEMVNP